MHSLHSWPIFPSDLEPPAACSLALLLILRELLSSFQLLDSLKKIPPPEPSDVYESLKKMVPLSWNPPSSSSQGVLDKLCFYCENLLKASKIREESILLILEEIRNSILNFKAKQIKSWKKKASFDENSLSDIRSLYASLREQFSSLFAALSAFLQELRTNESILVYLIEHRERFNGFLGSRTIEILLNRFFPSGMRDLRAAICEGYTRRGFTELYAQKEALLDAIEWEEAPCQPPFVS